MTKTNPSDANDASKSQATDPSNPFGNLGKLVEQFKLPGVDMNAIVESRRKDMEALMATNKAMVESLQELAKKQADVFAQAMHSTQEHVQSLAKKGGLPDIATQSEFARKAYEKAVADMHEMAAMARKAQTEAMAAITQRAQQSVEELKKFGQKK
ncbi:MAG: phasin family protein [Comamonas sp.]